MSMFVHRNDPLNMYKIPGGVANSHAVFHTFFQMFVRCGEPMSGGIFKVHP